MKLKTPIAFSAGLIVVISASAGLVLAQTQQPAPSTSANPAEASVCAKLNEADCTTKEGCSWLPGFKVPGSAEVPGYCRPAPRSINARRPKE